MWLKYQQVNAKMASFDPRECIMKAQENSEVIKHPLKRFEPTLRTSLRIVIPSNLDRLKKHKNNIEKYTYTKQWMELNKEQINATRTVQQLKATIRDLDNIKFQIREEDLDGFEKSITPMKQQSIQSIQEFASLEILILNEVKSSQIQANENRVSDKRVTQPTDTLDDLLFPDDTSPQRPITPQQIQNTQPSTEQITAHHSWEELRESLMELNSLVKDFATVVHHQQENVDRIEENIETAHENVHAGASYLGQASKYKAVMLPIGGAIAGGLMGGPIGMLAGFKLAGVVAAVGCAAAGYQGGKYMKRKQDHRVDVELSNLSKKDS